MIRRIWFGVALILMALAPRTAGQAPPPDIYHDPAGRFTLSIPWGWEIRKAADGDTFALQSAQMRVGTSAKEDPGEAVVLLSAYVMLQLQQADQIDRGEDKIAGLRHVYHVWRGMDKGVSRIRRVAAIRAPNVTYTLVTSAEQKDWEGVRAGVEAIEKSFRLAGVAGPEATPSATGQETACYVDPKGRFQLNYPAGWKRESRNDNEVSFWNNPAFFQVILAPNQAPEDLVNQYIKTLRASGQGPYPSTGRGTGTVAGINSVWRKLANPVPGRNTGMIDMKVTAFNSGGAGYILFAGTLHEQYSALEPVFQQMEQSFTLGGAARGAPAVPPPGPASVASPNSPWAGRGGYRRPARALPGRCPGRLVGRTGPKRGAYLARRLLRQYRAARRTAGAGLACRTLPTSGPAVAELPADSDGHWDLGRSAGRIRYVLGH